MLINHSFFNILRNLRAMDFSLPAHISHVGVERAVLHIYSLRITQQGRRY